MNVLVQVYRPHGMQYKQSWLFWMTPLNALKNKKQINFISSIFFYTASTFNEITWREIPNV